MNLAKERSSLIKWYRSNRRPLPWRENRDPYRIWISEVMLQQTTVTAVVPFYQKFLSRFPTLDALARADLEDVYQSWAGLGYYSRARNLHRAARLVHQMGFFPTLFSDLLTLPGFGPYTSRAVASLAFGQRVGVLDGNVIRVLSRHFALAVDWWKPKARAQLQEIADKLANSSHVAEINQGLMELGATVCTPKNPTCLLCPWSSSCLARTTHQIDQLPTPKPRSAKQNWLWTPIIYQKKRLVWVTQEHCHPFLKGHWLPPGPSILVHDKPKSFDIKGTVTKYDIFVRPTQAPVNNLKPTSSGKWVQQKNLTKHVPSSLARRAIAAALKSTSTGLMLALMANCKGKPIKEPSHSRPSLLRQEKVSEPAPSHLDYGKLRSVFQLTAEGINQQPTLSPDGTRLAYASSRRLQHERSQIYLYDLVRKTERRLTFQDGSASQPVFLYPPKKSRDPVPRLVFMSDTDEVKDLDFSVRAAQVKYGMREIPSDSSALGDLFMIGLDGKNQTRLTHSPGYDGQPAADQSGLRLAFVSNRTGEAKIYLMTGQHANPILLTPEKGFALAQPRLNWNSTQLVYQLLRLDRPGASLQISRTPFTNSKDLTSPVGFGESSDVSIDRDPQWVSNKDDLVLSSNRFDGRQFDIYYFLAEKSCLVRLSQTECNETEPVLSSDQKTLYFSSDCNGSWHIYKAEMPDQLTCDDAQPGR